MKQLSILTLLLALCWSCTSDYDDDSSPYQSKFSVAEARKYFENSNTQVADLTFSSTRSVPSVLTPDWGGAKITTTDDITTVETPLSDGELQAVTVVQTTPSGVSSVKLKTFKRLVTQYHKDGAIRQFVVTMAHAAETRSVQENNCYGKSDFSGYILVSLVDGEYQDAFESDGGLWTRQRVATQDPAAEDMTLEFSPYGSRDDILAPEGCIFCETCKMIFNFNDNPNGCPKCIESNEPPEPGGAIGDVVIIGHQTCGVCRSPKSQCKCCMWCRQYPCRCNWWVCVKCGSRYCDGGCRPSIGGGGGDSGGSGSGSGGSGGGASGSGAPNNCVATTDADVLQKLNKINEDCMGKTLLAALKDRKIPIENKPGIKAQYQRNYDNNGNYIGDVIYIGDEYPDVAFMEELIHAYQNSHTYSKNNHALNDEIEAKLGWVMYLNREGEDINNYKQYLVGASGATMFKRLNDLHASGVSLYNPENLSQYQYLYNKTAGFFRVWGSPYASESKYPFSKDQMYFKSLGELMANC